jgi:large subunit ribosomal protein L4
MIELPIHDKKGKKVDTLAIDEAMLGGHVRPVLLKQAYVMFHTNLRQGSARTKNRGRVEGSTRKLYKQKHTGNARMGTVRTNIRRGGGVAFAKVATREDYRLTMPKRMRRLANRNALLAKLVDGEVKCVDDMTFDPPKTATFRAMLAALGVDRTCLVALAPANRPAALAARNLADVSTVRVEQMNAFELLNHRYLVTDRASLEAFIDGSAWADDAGGREPAAKASAAKSSAAKSSAAKSTAPKSSAAAQTKPRTSRTKSKKETA